MARRCAFLAFAATVCAGSVLLSAGVASRSWEMMVRKYNDDETHMEYYCCVESTRWRLSCSWNAMRWRFFVGVSIQRKV
jgi:hypothetical protein